MTTEERKVVDEGIAAWRRLTERLREQRDQLLAATGNLCRELQCPAMEYLNPAVQNAWTKAFNLVEKLEDELKG